MNYKLMTAVWKSIRPN